MKRYIVNAQTGKLEEIGKFAAHYHVAAENIREATEKLLLFASSALDNPPVLEFLGNAWRSSHPVLEGINVEAGTKNRGDGRQFALCSTTVKHKSDIGPATSGFEYYSTLHE